MKLHLRIPYEENTPFVVSVGKQFGQMFDTTDSFSHVHRRHCRGVNSVSEMIFFPSVFFILPGTFSVKGASSRINYFELYGTFQIFGDQRKNLTGKMIIWYDKSQCLFSIHCNLVLCVLVRLSTKAPKFKDLSKI